MKRREEKGRKFSLSGCKGESLRDVFLKEDEEKARKKKNRGKEKQGKSEEGVEEIALEKRDREVAKETYGYVNQAHR